MFPISSTASCSHSSAFSVILSFSPHSSSALIVSLFLQPCFSPSLPSLSFASNLFFLTFNLLLNNYLSSMADDQRLVLQEKSEIHLPKPLYVQQVSFTTGIPAVCGIGNPALHALSSLQSSPIELTAHESCVHKMYNTLVGDIWHFNCHPLQRYFLERRIIMQHF